MKRNIFLGMALCMSSAFSLFPSQAVPALAILNQHFVQLTEVLTYERVHKAFVAQPVPERKPSLERPVTPVQETRHEFIETETRKKPQERSVEAALTALEAERVERSKKEEAKKQERQKELEKKYEYYSQEIAKTKDSNVLESLISSLQSYVNGIPYEDREGKTYLDFHKLLIVSQSQYDDKKKKQRQYLDELGELRRQIDAETNTTQAIVFSNQPGEVREARQKVASGDTSSSNKSRAEYFDTVQKSKDKLAKLIDALDKKLQAAEPFIDSLDHASYTGTMNQGKRAYEAADTWITQVKEIPGIKKILPELYEKLKDIKQQAEDLAGKSSIEMQVYWNNDLKVFRQATKELSALIKSYNEAYEKAQKQGLFTSTQLSDYWINTQEIQKLVDTVSQEFAFYEVW